MDKVRLGRTGLEVSAVGFGGIPLTRIDFDQAEKLILRALELGVTFFDTANMYGDSEAKLGRVLAGRRDEVVIATKSFERTAEGAAAHIELSLERLQTDRIDLFQFHNLASAEELDKVLAPGGAMEAAKREVDRGRIGHLGFSSHNLDAARKAVETGLFETVQIPFNFVEWDPVERLFPAAREHDVGLIAMKPLGGGLLDRAELCFGFLREHPEVVPIPGLQAMEEIEEIAALYQADYRLTEADRAEIERIKSELGNRFCHRCEYCMPCPEGVLIPRVLLFESQVRRFEPQMLAGLAGEAMASAENCVQCGQCEERCPYDLPVTEMIEDMRARYRRFLDGLGQA